MTPDTAQDALQNTVRIVLLEPLYAGNIGAVARAMKTMGLRQLTLVNPQQFPSKEATYRAVAAVDLLQAAQVVDTLDEALADCQFVVGTSAVGRRIPWPLLDARDTAERIAEQAFGGAQVAIVFGREDHGLSTEELQRCHLHCQIPTHADYTSLNLAMAVQILTYELRMQCLSEAPTPVTWDAPPATVADMERFYTHLESTLVEIGFLDPKAPRQLMPRLRRLFGRVHLDAMEVNILRGILTETQKSVRDPRRD